MYDTDFLDEEELLWEALKLPERLYRVLEQRSEGYAPKEIASRLGIEPHSVEAYNGELNFHFGLEKKGWIERYRFYVTIGKQLVDHINAHPELRKRIADNPDYEYQPSAQVYSGPTFRFPKLIAVDPDDPKRIVHFLTFIVVALVLGVVILFTVLALLAGSFTFLPSGIVYS